MTTPEQFDLPSRALEELHKDVMTNGDTADAVGELRMRSRYAFHVPTQLGVISWMMATEAGAGKEILLTYPFYAIGGYALAESASRFRKHRMERSIAVRESEQDVLRNILGEPVDLALQELPDESYETILLWHGAKNADDSNETRRSLASRLEKIALVAQKTNVAAITIDKAWLVSDDVSIDLPKYGEDLEDHRKKKTAYDIVDKTYVVPFRMTTDKCLELARDVLELSQLDVRHFLSEAVRKADEKSVIPTLFGEWVKAGADPSLLAGLKRRLKSEIQRHIEFNHDMVLHTERDEEDGSMHRVRQHVSTSVQGEVVRKYGSFVDRNGHNRIMHAGDTSLLSYTSANTVAELIAQIDAPVGESSTTALDAKIALLLDLQSPGRIDSEMIGEQPKDSTQTYFQRIQSERPWWTKRQLRKQYGIDQSNILSISLASKGPAHLIGRILIPYAGIAFAFVGCGIINSQSIDHAAAPNVIESVDLSMQRAQASVVEGELAIGDALGFGDWLRTFLPASPPTVVIKEVPINPPNLSAMPAGIGDLDHSKGSNQVEYTVMSYNGADTKGYWATQVLDEMTMQTDPSFPFTDASLSFKDSKLPSDDNKLEKYQEQISLPMKPASDTDVAFKVMTPYVNPSGWTALPVKDGTYPIAVSLEYIVGNVAFQEVPKVVHDTSNGTYTITSSNHGVSLPTTGKLTYWLGKNTSAIHARGPMQMPLDVHMAAVSAATKQGLGLPADADTLAVEDAIRAKKYSFTPFKDSYGEGITTGYKPFTKDNTKPLSIIGSIMGKTPEALCNTAETQDILATNGKHNGLDINMVAGYHNDGDNLLTTDEGHNWSVTTTGGISGIIDVTPGGSADAVRKISIVAPEPAIVERNHLQDLLDASEVVALAGLGTIAFKRRRSIVTAWRDNRAVAVLKRPATQQAISALKHAEWGPMDGSHFSERRMSTIQSSSQPVLDQLKGVADVSYTDALQQLRSKGVTISPSVGRAMKAMLKWRGILLSSVEVPIRIAK